jgi:cellulose synthase/poly-beta-1,6-N-acetylglucosamine synthase-like glycosyltransferase
VTVLSVLAGLADLVLTVAVLGMVLIGAGFLVLIARFLYDQARGVQDPPGVPIAEADLPHVLVQIPVYNEGAVVENAMRCAAALDWPRDRLTIQLLDDSTDSTSEIAANVIAELRAAGTDAVHVQREDRSGFKAAACAAGLRLSDAPYIAMLDVDFRPPADWLRRAIPVIVADPQAAFVQTRCEFSNFAKSWLTRAQGLIMDGHFLVEQRTRALAGWLFQFNGTGGIWRRSVVDEVGGWLDYSLTEDLDLTIRAALRGHHGLFISEPVVPGQVPEDMRDWRRQQRRWSNGFIQVARRTIGPMWNAPWSLMARLSAVWLVLHQVFFPLCAIAIIALLFGIVLHGFSLAPYVVPCVLVLALIFAVVLGMTLPPYLALRRGPVSAYVQTMLSLPPLFIYLAVSNAPKIIQTARGRREHFKRTPKQEHGHGFGDV